MQTWNKCISVLLGYSQIIAHWALGLLPIDFCSAIGNRLGRIIGPMHRIATQKLRENITQLRPDLQPMAINQMVQRSWGNYGRVMAEFSVLRRIWKSDRVDITGLEHFIKAKATGRPVICLFVHLGNWEVIGPKLHALLGGDWIQIYQMLDNPYQLRIAEQVRRPYAHELITSGPFVGKKIYNKLKAGYTLNIAVDECVNEDITIPAFGRSLQLAGNLTFAVRLAKLTNAVFCPVYAMRTQGARFTVQVLPPVVFDFTEFDQGKLLEAVSTLNHTVESIIREHLDQWYYCAQYNTSQLPVSHG